MLQSDAEAEQSLRRARPGAFDRRAVLDVAVSPAVARRPREEPHPGRHFHGGVAAALDLDGQDASTAAHLPGRHVVAGMVRQAGIVDRGDTIVLGQELRDAERVIGVRTHPVGQAPDRAEHEPAIER